jgi:DNA-binding CsgD family transcriptional regulator
VVLTEAGDLAAAERACTAGLTWCREVGDLGNLSYQLWNMAVLDLQAGRIEDATAHLHEQLQIAMQTGLRLDLLVGLDGCGYLCASTRRPAEAVTVWAAMSALAGPWPLPYGPRSPGRRDELMRQARQLLGPDRTQAAEDRGAAMSPATAAEYALMVATAESQPLAVGATAAHRAAADGAAADGAAADGAAGTTPGLDKLSPRERELVTLVAQGRTDAQIAAQLYISVRTVSSHLDRIRDKTGCRRRTDLTRLALGAGLV